MGKRVDSGLWELFAPGAGEGTNYKYEIIGPNGDIQPLKADPMGFCGEMRPSTASVVTRTDNFTWHDEAHMAARQGAGARSGPMSVYEVHLGSWRRNDGGASFPTTSWRSQLIPYVVDMGFTHIELLPVSEHPFDGFLGLPAHRPFRADSASATRRAFSASSRRATWRALA